MFFQKESLLKLFQISPRRAAGGNIVEPLVSGLFDQPIIHRRFRMSESQIRLDKFPAIDHMVLLRVYGPEGGLRAILPNRPPHQDALRVLHGVQDKDGRIGPAEAKRGLEALAGLGMDKGNPAAEVLRHCAAVKSHRSTMVASPRSGLRGPSTRREGGGGEEGTMEKRGTPREGRVPPGAISSEPVIKRRRHWSDCMETNGVAGRCVRECRRTVCA